MDVHFQGSFYASHAVYPIMREQNFGRIIFTTSSGGFVEILVKQTMVQQKWG